MKILRAAIGVFKVLLLFCMICNAGSVVAQGSIISVPTIPGKSLCDLDFPLLVNPTSPAPLIYTSSNESVATISSTGIVHIVGIGTTIITVLQPGNPTTGSATLNITQPSPPRVTIAVDLSSVCLGAPVTFTATVSDFGVPPTYQWQVNGANVGTSSATYVASGITATDAVQCIATIGNCHLTGFSKNITGIIAKPYVTPSISITPSVTGTICLGSNVTFTATPVNGSTSPFYQWKINGTNTGTNAAIFSSNNLINGDVVTCTLAVSGPGCFAPAVVISNSINISAASAAVGTVGITASTNNVIAGMPITFTATSTLPATHYQWKVNGVNVGMDSPTFTSRILKTGDAVTCIILISASCTAALISQPIVMTILPPPAIHITNTFTPNNDGVNDVWDVPDLAYFPDCVVNIYNRYGALVFQSKGYSKAWDGTYKGRQLPVATYYYIINLNSVYNTTRYSGAITIIR
ncbi:gliding motility-associated C-terminal domain-containing protein [Mucilaginibacter sp.]|uniref:gliding motility-associated C-terminal domain-containing protein n=1 Tax=Mucilaginibacter sp. TaxID=1882438 RepID=UPI002602B6C8|nr:gliding motility-associated C-terminal domain-containing protein [Mucilaginibacter sp.]